MRGAPPPPLPPLNFFLWTVLLQSAVGGGVLRKNTAQEGPQKNVPDQMIESESRGIKWASMRENLSLGLANNKEADQHAHPRNLISAFVIPFLESIISKLATGEIC